MQRYTLRLIKAQQVQITIPLASGEMDLNQGSLVECWQKKHAI
jgi:hypothetical protein